MSDARFVIRPDGPDGRVDHFYADGNLKPLEVISADRVVELEAVLRAANSEIAGLRAENERLRNTLAGAVEVLAGEDTE